MSENGSDSTNTGRIIEIKGVVIDAVFPNSLPVIAAVLSANESISIPIIAISFGKTTMHNIHENNTHVAPLTVYLLLSYSCSRSINLKYFI